MAARTTPGNKRQQPQLPTVDMEVDDEFNQTMEIAPPAKKPTLARTKATVRPVVQDPDTFTFNDAVADQTPIRIVDLRSKTTFTNMTVKIFGLASPQLSSIIGYALVNGSVIKDLARWAKCHSKTQEPYDYLVGITNKKDKEGRFIALAIQPWMSYDEVRYEDAVSREKRSRDKAEYAASEVASVLSDDTSAFGF